MTRIYAKFDPEDFQARIRFFPLEEAGRRPYPNGIRFDFKYAENDNHLYMIHPDFFDARGNSLSMAEMLPFGIWLAARMYIVIPEMREKVHRLKIKEGVKFYCIDGRPVAEGVVSKVVG